MYQTTVLGNYLFTVLVLTPRILPGVRHLKQPFRLIVSVIMKDRRQAKNQIFCRERKSVNIPWTVGGKQCRNSLSGFIVARGSHISPSTRWAFHSLQSVANLKVSQIKILFSGVKGHQLIWSGIG